MKQKNNNAKNFELNLSPNLHFGTADVKEKILPQIAVIEKMPQDTKIIAKIAQDFPIFKIKKIRVYDVRSLSANLKFSLKKSSQGSKRQSITVLEKVAESMGSKQVAVSKGQRVNFVIEAALLKRPNPPNPFGDLIGSLNIYDVGDINNAMASWQLSIIYQNARPRPPKIVWISAGCFPGDARISMSWKRSIGATDYIIYRSTTGDSGSFSEIARQTSCQFDDYDPNLQTGTEYYYQVVALNKVNGYTSVPSNTVEKMTNLDPPTGISLVPVSKTEIDITWNLIPNAVGYIVHCDKIGLDLDNTGPPPYRSRDLMLGTTYGYRIAAVNAKGAIGYWSDWNYMTTLT